MENGREHVGKSPLGPIFSLEIWRPGTFWAYPSLLGPVDPGPGSAHRQGTIPNE